jgi:parvulin-like peptidyl-prolyl isomerase
MAYIQLGNQTITAAEVISLLASYQMLPQLQRELIINKAIAEVELTPEEKSSTISKFYQNNQIITPAALDAVLQRYCMTVEQLEALATKELRVEKFKQTTWGGMIKQNFLQYKPQLDKVVYSLLRTQDMEVAQELYFRIKAGEQSFADCAREFSQGVEATTGGLIGPVPMSQPHPAIVQKLSISKEGQLWTPMKLENWYIIIRLEKLIPAQLDDATGAILLNHLFEKWLGEQIQQTPISIQDNQDKRERKI